MNNPGSASRTGAGMDRCLPPRPGPSDERVPVANANPEAHFTPGPS